MAGEEETSIFPLTETQTDWEENLERGHSQTDELQQKLGDITSCIQESSKDAKKELEILWRRVRTTTTLLTYLESKARIMIIPHLPLSACGIQQLDVEGFIDKSGNVCLSNLDSREVEKWVAGNGQTGLFDEKDGSYFSEILNSVQTVTGVMEFLVKRVLVAESECSNANQKASLGQEEIKKKAIQIDAMSEKLDEMVRFATGTNCVLNEMRKRVEDLVEETARHRQRAAENEQELTRMKRDFESLKSYVSSLVSVRETLVSSEKQFQTIERLFER